MDTIGIVILAFAAAIIGFVLCYIFYKKKTHDLFEENIRLKCDLDKEKEKYDSIYNSARDMLSLNEQRHKEEFEAQEKRFNLIVEKMQDSLKLSTNEMLKQRQKEFSESSSSSIGQIVNPLKETIDKMKKSMDDSTIKQTELGAQMKTKIEDLMLHSEAARKSADELANALKHGTKVQGDWGETVLNELLESQGLVSGIHYDIQSLIRDERGNVIKNETGSMLRPDIILHLDQKRDVVIDSKVSLTSFIDYVNADNEEERNKFLKAHIDSLWKHVTELAAKDYSSYIKYPKLRIDYVIMFVPNTGALWAALNVDTGLWRRAMEKNVFIADEQTLFAALRIINMTWSQIEQAQNHEKVYDLANEILDRVGQFVKKYEAIGKALENASKAYEEGERKLSPSGQSILQTCAKLEKLGARQSDKNPLPMLKDSEL